MLPIRGCFRLTCFISLSLPIFDHKDSQLGRRASKLCCRKCQGGHRMFKASLQIIIAKEVCKLNLIPNKRNVFFSVFHHLNAKLFLWCHSEIRPTSPHSTTWNVSVGISRQIDFSTLSAKSRSGIPIYENRAGTDDALLTICTLTKPQFFHPSGRGWCFSYCSVYCPPVGRNVPRLSWLNG